MSQAQTSETHPPGFYWHVHHKILLEWCYDYQERARFIRERKDSHEVPIRLRLFTPVRGALPETVTETEQALQKAWRASLDAGQAHAEARLAFRDTGQAHDATEQALQKAGQAHDATEQALQKAWQAYDKALTRHMPAIEALHRQEHPDCPWNGETIFPEAV